MLDSKVAKCWLEKSGICQSQPIEDWAGPVALPKEIASFYKDVGPQDVDVDTLGHPISFVPLIDLWDLQDGYRDDDETNQCWPKNWIVIAQHGGNAFFYDCETKKVGFTECGQGGWGDFDLLFNDLNEFAVIVGLLAKCCEEQLDIPAETSVHEAVAELLLGDTDEKNKQAYRICTALPWE